jgi:hypothetical protein
MTQDCLSDIQEIRDLGLRYAQGLDRGDGEAFSSLFVEDGVLDGSGFYNRGWRQLSEVPARLAGKWFRTFHAVHNHLVAIVSDSASGEVYSTAHHLRRDPDGGFTDYVMFIRYQDTYARTSAGWRFVHREVGVAWTETRPAALHKPPA